MRVGTKELKNRLSYYLRRVRQGEAVEVTDRGSVVAELRAARPQPKGDAQVIAELEAEGLLSRARVRRSDFPPLKPKRPVRLSQLVLEDRG